MTRLADPIRDPKLAALIHVLRAIGDVVLFVGLLRAGFTDHTAAAVMCGTLILVSLLLTLDDRNRR